MSRPVVCPHCGEELDIPSELRGREVRCAACRNVFSAAADAPPPPRATRTRSRSTPDDNRAPWEDRPRRQRKGSLLWLWLLLGGGGFLTCGCCVGLLVLGFQLDNPKLLTHDSPKGRFTALFPEKPIEAQRVGADGLTRECTEASRDLFLGTDEKYFVHYRDLAAEPSDDKARQDVLQDAATKTVSEIPSTREHKRTKLTVSGYPALDVFMTHPDGEVTYLRLVLAGKRLYAVGLTAPGLQAESMRLKKFLDGFQVTGVRDDVK